MFWYIHVMMVKSKWIILANYFDFDCAKSIFKKLTIEPKWFRQSEKLKRHVSTIICSEIVTAGELHLGLISTEQIKMMEICIRSFYWI